MGKLDKVLEVATPIAKEAAKGTAKLTGKGLKIAGKGIKKAGETAIDSYKDNKEERVQELIDEIKECYPGCALFSAYDVSVFNRDKLNNMGGNVSNYDLNNHIVVFFDESNIMKFKIVEVYDSIFRRSTLFSSTEVVNTLNNIT